jgi:malate synthase
MEDAATAEISRTQVWQWVHHPRGILADARKVTLSLVLKWTEEELARIRRERGEARFESGHFPLASRLFNDLVASKELEPFLTLKAYPLLDGARKTVSPIERGNKRSTGNPQKPEQATKRELVSTSN